MRDVSPGAIATKERRRSMRTCPDHTYRRRDCAACTEANPPLRTPLSNLRPVVDEHGMVTFRMVGPDEALEEIVGWVEGEVRA